MKGYVDLHAHWVPGIDDGVKTLDDGLALLSGLRALGFSTCVATPHMRPGMFDNDAARLRAAYGEIERAHRGRDDLPRIALSSEHWLDDVVFTRLLRGEALPYPGSTAALVELPPEAFPVSLSRCVFELRQRGLRPVLAHPERYAPVWSDDEVLTPLLDAGVVLQLDLCSLVGKYGRRPQKAAEKLLADGAYYLAATDAHRPHDLAEVGPAIERLHALAGSDEARFLLSDGPSDVLAGTVKT